MNKPPRVVYLDSKREQRCSILVCHACRENEFVALPNKYDVEAYLYCGSCGSKDVTAFLDIDFEEPLEVRHSKKSWTIYQRHLKKR